MECVRCPNRKSTWWKFVLAIFYFIILFFNINVVSSQFQSNDIHACNDTYTYDSWQFEELVVVYHLNNTGHWTYSTRLFYDSTLPYFRARHLPYAIVALTVTTLFVLLPVLLLVLYPFRCFQSISFSLVHSMAATKMGHSQGLVTVDGLLPSSSFHVSV